MRTLMPIIGKFINAKFMSRNASMQTGRNYHAYLILLKYYTLLIDIFIYTTSHCNK